MNTSDSPPIVAQHVTLRHFEPEDSSKVFVMSQESGICTWIPDQVYESEPAALEVLQYLIEKYRDPGSPSLAPYVLGVSLNGSRELIGHVGLSPLDGQVEVGYAIEVRHQGKGLAVQAVRAMTDWALARYELPHVIGIVATDNIASCKVLEHAGFKLAEESMGRLHNYSGIVRRYDKARLVTNGHGDS